MRTGRALREAQRDRSRPAEDPDDYAERDYRLAIENRENLRRDAIENHSLGLISDETLATWMRKCDEHEAKYGPKTW